MSEDADGPIFACHCLNIRIFQRIRAQNTSPPQTTAEGFSPVYIGDDGIIIEHNELTLRSRSPISAINDTSETKYIQYTLVSCLVCEDSVYRVKAEVQPDMDAKEGPIIPTEDWVERNTLLSKSGWVEVHCGKGGCISRDEVRQLLSSPAYSSTFSLAVPKKEHVLSTEPTSILSYSKYSLPPSHTLLPALPPLLLPPPFTPSHPIFLHLSSVASDVSSEARLAAEKRIYEYAQTQLTQLEEEETKLKTQLEELWRHVKDGLRKAESLRDSKLYGRRHSSVSGILSPAGPAISASIRSFVPSTYRPPRSTVASTIRQSALSASLATTSFHHPRALQEARAQNDISTVHPLSTPSPPPYASNPSTLSSSSENGRLSRSLKRNMDITNDTAVTFRYYTIEEQEAARRKARQDAEQDAAKKENGQTKSGTNQIPESKQEVASSTPAGHKKSSSVSKVEDSPRKKTARRKVTFDAEPEVVTIKRDIKNEKESYDTSEKGEDLIFDIDVLDDEESESSQDNDTDAVEHLPNKAVPAEQIEQDQKESYRPASIVEFDLPQSFRALRPSSLPAPSHIRPPLRLQNPREHDPSFTSRKPPVKQGSLINKSSDTSEDSTQDEELQPNQKRLLDLVAANTPSHRGAWDSNSRAWKAFNRSGKRVESDEESDSSLDDALDQKTGDTIDTNWRLPDFVGSLPIPMAPVSQQKRNAVFSLQSKTPLSGHQSSAAPTLPSITEEKDDKSAVMNRKAAYAERNRARGIDPGILNFVENAEDDEEEESADYFDKDGDVNQVSTSRSRQYALNIIKARNSVPAEGLWRSLA